MDNSIMIIYPLGGSTGILVDYNIELTGNLQTIHCHIAPTNQPLPGWLHIKKFSIPSLKEGDSYIAIFDNANNNTSTETSLFIDQVYKDIMKEECLMVYQG